MLENKRGQVEPLPRTSSLGTSAEKAHARDFDDSSNVIPHDDALMQFAARSILDDLFSGGALNARKFDSRQEIQARGLFTALMKFAQIYKLGRGAGVIFGRHEIISDQLAISRASWSLGVPRPWIIASLTPSRGFRPVALPSPRSFPRIAHLMN